MTTEHPKSGEIPLLTQVYKPKSNVEKSLEVGLETNVLAKQALKDRAETILPRFAHTELNLSITPEFIARVTGHVRPRLEAEITVSVLDSVRDAIKKDLLVELKQEVIKAQSALQTNTIDFIDKTKADLKTELPKMYQASAKLAQLGLADNIAEMQTNAVSTVDRLLSDVLKTTVQTASEQINAHLEAVQAESSANLAKQINAQIRDFQETLLSEHQASLANQLTGFYEANYAKAELSIQSHTNDLTVEAKERLQNDFLQEMPAIYAQTILQEQPKTIATITEQLAQSLLSVQSQLIVDHQSQLNQLLADIFKTHIEQAKIQAETHLQTIHAEAILNLQNNLNEAVPVIFNQASQELKNNFTQDLAQASTDAHQRFLVAINGDLPDVQAVLAQNINEILSNTLPTLQEDLRKQLLTQLQELLTQVKFVLPG